MIKANGDNLVFLVSAPRSGSTLLGAMLGTLPEVTCPPEIWLQLLLGSIIHTNVSLEARYDHDLALKAFYEAAGKNRIKKATQDFALTIYNELLMSKKDCRLLVDKTPRYYHLLRELAQQWPKAKFLWIQRNPLDVVASCKETWSLSVEEQMAETVTPHSYDTTLAFDRLISFFVDDAQGSAVRYEDLTADPTKTLKTICRYLAVPFSRDMLEYGKNEQLVSNYRSSHFGDKKILGHTQPHKNSVGKWRSVLTKTEINLVVETLGARLFEAQGYGTEFREACKLVKVSASNSLPAGCWEEKLSGRTANNKSALSAQPYFAAARLVRKQEDEIEKLRAQLLDLTSRSIQIGNESEGLRNERNLLQAQLADLRKNFDAAEQDRLERGRVIDQQGKKLTRLEAEFDVRLKELTPLYASAEALKNERNLLQAQLADLQQNFTAVEKDRIARGEVINHQGSRITYLENLIWLTEQNRDWWKAACERQALPPSGP